MRCLLLSSFTTVTHTVVPKPQDFKVRFTIHPYYMGMSIALRIRVFALHVLGFLMTRLYAHGVFVVLIYPMCSVLLPTYNYRLCL